MIMGSGFWAQIHIENSYHNSLLNNTFSPAAYDGVQIYSSSYTTFCNNTLIKSGIFVYESYHNIIENNTINNKPLIYLENIYDYVIVEAAGQIVLVNCDNISIRNQTIVNSIQGIELFRTSNSTILNCSISLQEFESVYAVYSNDNLISHCVFSDCNNALGIYSCNRIEINSNYIYSFTYIDPCVIIEDSNYNDIIWNNITDSFRGIELHGSNYNNISQNELYKLSSYSANGVIRLHGSKFNNITFNNIHNQHRGIDLYDSSNNNLVMRNIVDCGKDFTVVVGESDNNLIYHNYFGKARPYDYGTNNTWDDSYPSGGNFWINYNGEDKDNDGIGDTRSCERAQDRRRARPDPRRPPPASPGRPWR